MNVLTIYNLKETSIEFLNFLEMIVYKISIKTNEWGFVVGPSLLLIRHTISHF